MDATTDHPVHIVAGQADVSLQHRLRLDHVQEEKVQRPAKARSEVSAVVAFVNTLVNSGGIIVKTRQGHARRAAPDDDERQVGALLPGIPLIFRELERR